MASHESNHAAYLKGDVLWKQGRFKEAAHSFLAAVNEWPEDYQSFWALGNCYTELKKPRKAERCFRQAIALCPSADKPVLVFNLANALFDQKRYASAITLHSQIPAGHALSRKAKRKNGALLDSAESEGFSVLVTTDTNLKYQQNLAARKIATVVLTTTS